MGIRKKKANPQFPSGIGKTKGDRLARIHYALLIGAFYQWQTIKEVFHEVRRLRLCDCHFLSA
jgi:hypothetical protein